jgi:hypothetical protein
MPDVNYVKMKLEDIKPAPYNPRKIGKKAKQGLAESLDRFGLVQKIIVNKRTNFIIGGHQRYDHLKELKVEETVVCQVDLDDQEERALNMALNNPEIQGQWTEKIDTLLDSIKSATPTLYETLQFDSLEERLDREAGINMQCPCCKYKWFLKNTQARIMGKEELEACAEDKAVPLEPPTKGEEQDVQNLADEMSEDAPEDAPEDAQDVELSNEETK